MMFRTWTDIVGDACGSKGAGWGRRLSVEEHSLCWDEKPVNIPSMGMVTFGGTWVTWGLGVTFGWGQLLQKTKTVGAFCLPLRTSAGE